MNCLYVAVQPVSEKVSNSLNFAENFNNYIRVMHGQIIEDILIEIITDKSTAHCRKNSGTN